MAFLPRDHSTESVSLSHQKQAIVANTTSRSRTTSQAAGDRYDEYSRQRARLPRTQAVNTDTGTDGHMSRRGWIVSSLLRTISGERISHTPIPTISDQSMSVAISSLLLLPTICTNQISMLLANTRKSRYSNNFSSSIHLIYHSHEMPKMPQSRYSCHRLSYH